MSATANRVRDRQIRLGLISVLLFVGISLIAMSQVVPRVLAPDGETVVAEFETAGQLDEGDPVRVDGVAVGEVEEIGVTPGGRSAIVRMEVQEEGQPLYRDASAVLRWRTVLGGALVVDLDPGSPSSGELGSETISISRTSEQVELDEFTTALGNGAARGMQDMFRELPRALRDPSLPEGAFGTLADVAPTVARAADALRGQREGDLRALVRSTADVMRALDAPSEPAKALVEGAARTLATTGGRKADLQRMLELAPPVMDRAVATLERLDGTLARADSLFALLSRPAPDLGPTARALRPTLAGAERLLRDAQPLFRSLRPALSDLEVTSREGVPLLRDLQPTLRRLDARILPRFADVDPVSRRASFEMVGPTASALTFGGFDAESHYFTLAPMPHPHAGGTILDLLSGAPSEGRRR